MSAPMFERGHDMKLTVGSISAYPNNLSVCYLESRNITYACVVQKTQVHTVNWDSKNESVSWDSINISDTSTDKPVNVLQASLVLPNARTLPLLVVGTTIGAQIFDMRTQKLLEQQLIDTGISEPDDTSFWSSFCRGITCNDNTILVGTSIGHIMQFHCSGETSITTKKWLKEHTASISDLATCRYDDITCSGDSSGKINVWNKSIKGVQLKIATQHPITAMSVLRKQVIVGTLRGRVLFYSISGGELMAEVLAHARAITCISVAPESAYVLTGSEDGRFIVYKLHTRKPQAYQVKVPYEVQLLAEHVGVNHLVDSIRRRPWWKV
ncbi:WD domain, G-beta repeat protein [Cooperia oncophora]